MIQYKFIIQISKEKWRYYSIYILYYLQNYIIYIDLHISFFQFRIAKCIIFPPLFNDKLSSKNTNLEENKRKCRVMELRNRGRSIQRIIHRFFPLLQSLLVKKNEFSTSIRMCITPLDPLTIITEIQFSSFLSAVRIENY